MQEFDSAPATNWLDKDTRCLCSGEAGYSIDPSTFKFAPECLTHSKEPDVEAQACIYAFDNDIDVIDGHLFEA